MIVFWVSIVYYIVRGDAMRKVLMILSLLSISIFLTGCVGEKIKGEDIYEDFIRSENYYVEFGTETHFEMGVLMPSGMHVVCGDDSYYADGYGKYTEDQGTVVSYVEINNENYILDMPNTKSFPIYDINVFESNLFENNYQKSIVSSRYSYRDDGLSIKFRDYDEEFSYEISLPDDDMIYRFNNEVKDGYCENDLSLSETVSLSDYIEDFLDDEGWRGSISNNLLEEQLYNEEDNTISIQIEEGGIVFYLDNHEIEFLLDGVEAYSYHLDREEMNYSWNNRTSFGYIPPESIHDVINYHDYYVFVNLFRDYHAIFIGDEDYYMTG